MRSHSHRFSNDDGAVSRSCLAMFLLALLIACSGGCWGGHEFSKPVSDMTDLASRLTFYYFTKGKVLPESLDALTRVDLQDHPRLRSVPVDPWGRPYEYKRTGTASFEIVSRGADGRPGGEGGDQDLRYAETVDP